MLSFKEIRENTEAKKLAHEFASNKRITSKLTYFQIVKLLIDINKSGSDIAEEAGISNTCFSNNYPHYFAPFFEAKTLAVREEARRKMYAKQKAELLMQVAEREDATIKRIIESAKSAGLHASCVVRHEKGSQSPTGTYQRAVMIAGKKCSIRVLVNEYQRKEHVQVYATTTMRRELLDEYDTFIFLVQVPGYEERLLVIPTADIRAQYFDRAPKAVTRSIHIPLLKRLKGARLDFGQYENAWTKLRSVDASRNKAQ